MVGGEAYQFNGRWTASNQYRVRSAECGGEAQPEAMAGVDQFAASEGRMGPGLQADIASGR